jgi:NADH-ubiquinone oxidoreductase chain 6
MSYCCAGLLVNQFIFEINMILFSIFSSIALVSGIMVIRAKNPVHSVLFLILVFCNSSALLVLLGLDFFAMILLVVYVGAIAVLFLFVVMMLNIKIAEIHENALRYLPVGGIIGLIFLLEIFLIVDNDYIPLFESGRALAPDGILDNVEYGDQVLAKPNKGFGVTTVTGIQEAAHFLTYTAYAGKIQNWTNLESIGALVYTSYFILFLVSSLILLVAMIGAIVLTMHKTSKVKRQDVFQQNAINFQTTIKKIRT